MKLTRTILVLSAALPLAGCATHQGGTYEDYNAVASASESSTEPLRESPTFRPGMNPYDPRDAHYGTGPQPGKTMP
jgi:hypothetical protein